MPKINIIIVSAIITAALLITGCNNANTESKTEAPFAKVEFTSTSEEEPILTDYTPELLEELNGNKPYAVFFHALWCPQCVIMERQLKANIEDFPKGTKFLKADFDKETELKARFGVTVQSTVVIVGADGEVIQKLPFTNFFTASQAVIDSIETHYQ